jgi:hypothetical protein
VVSEFDSRQLGDVRWHRDVFTARQNKLDPQREFHSSAIGYSVRRRSTSNGFAASSITSRGLRTGTHQTHEKGGAERDPAIRVVDAAIGKIY